MRYSSQANPVESSKPAEGLLSVTSLNRMARSLLEAHFPSVVVEGEISNLARPASGHWYLTLKDKSSQIRCAMFVNRNRSVRFQPQNGNQIIVRGRLSIYEGRGDYQLIVDSMEEAGDGALQRAFEELKLRLQGEGLFDTARKQDVPSQCDHIGVITSPTGAAIQDIISVFRRRFPATALTVFPVAVQGQDAPAEIVRAIELANQHRVKLRLQALIVGRGGGSLEDLQAFNEERVARAIAASQLPVTSAVGHEIDFTIADFVADLRAPTPSAAAELMSPDQQDYAQMFSSYQAQFGGAIRQLLGQARQQMEWLARRLIHPSRQLQEQSQNLDRLEVRLCRAVDSRIATQSNQLVLLHKDLLANSPGQRLIQSQLKLGNELRRLKQALQTVISNRRANLAELSRSLNAVSPLSTLARGYSITYDESAKVVCNSDDVKPGARIISRLSNGSIASIVESISDNKLSDSKSSANN